MLINHLFQKSNWQSPGYKNHLLGFNDFHCSIYKVGHYFLYWFNGNLEWVYHVLLLPRSIGQSLFFLQLPFLRYLDPKLWFDFHYWIQTKLFFHIGFVLELYFKFCHFISKTQICFSFVLMLVCQIELVSNGDNNLDKGQSHVAYIYKQLDQLFNCNTSFLNSTCLPYTHHTSKPLVDWLKIFAYYNHECKTAFLISLFQLLLNNMICRYRTCMFYSDS